MAYTRISARRGQQVDLDVTFLQGGIAADPYAIYRIEIYQGKVADDKIVAAVDIPAPSSSDYPLPLVKIGSGDGHFRYTWDVPSDLVVPDVYFDVWYFYGSNPISSSSGSGSGSSGSSGSSSGSSGSGSGSSGSSSGSNSSGSSTDLNDLSLYTTQLTKVCNRFWVYPDQWYADGGLQTIRLGFEPLDKVFRKPEVRPLEVGMMPLPLYDYDFNLVTPILPYTVATIEISTENCERIVDDVAITIKLRQGAYRSNPFVLSYLLDTSDFLIGTYKYRITIQLPDGTTRTSDSLYFTIV